MTSTKSPLQRSAAIAVAIALVAAPLGRAQAQGGSVVVFADDDADEALARRVKQQIQRHRTVLPLRPLPPVTQSPEQLANADRVEAISHALERARRHEEVAAWDACAKEAGDKLSSATEVLATTGNLNLLRDLHLEIGACLSLGPSPADAQPHFRKATLLDESAPPKGRHREEAELALDRARAEVLARQRGPVRIDTDPPGAELWIDGTKVDGETPVSVPVRLGAHFVTLRRFRYEPQTTQALLQPKSELRFVLAPAQRDTLRRQLAEVGAEERTVPESELRLARARFSGAEEMVEIHPVSGPTQSPAVRLELVEPLTGATIRSQMIPEGVDDDDLRDRVCTALGEACPEESSGIPWYIWPIAGVAVTGGAVALGFYLDSQRTTAFCPAGGC